MPGPLASSTFFSETKSLLPVVAVMMRPQPTVRMNLISVATATGGLCAPCPRCAQLSCLRITKCAARRARQHRTSSTISISQIVDCALFVISFLWGAYTLCRSLTSISGISTRLATRLGTLPR
jgi:hypothetical protein